MSASIATGSAPLKVFVSYSHTDQAWVLDRLGPVLRAGGLQVIIDVEAGKAGREVVGQMDAWQDRADRQILVLSKAYLASAYCRHELQRAVVCDPQFDQGIVVPVQRDDERLPVDLFPALQPDGAQRQALHVDFRDDRAEAPWTLLTRSLGIDLGCNPAHWLGVRDEVVRELHRGTSVNLAVIGAPNHKALIEEVQTRHIPAMGIVDLYSGTAATRSGLIGDMLGALGEKDRVPPEPYDLGHFDRVIKARPSSIVALRHFDTVTDRRDYGNDLFRTLRHLQENRHLVVLLQTRGSLVDCLPKDHDASKLQAIRIGLGAKP